jgi:hypothetical protein
MKRTHSIGFTGRFGLASPKRPIRFKFDARFSAKFGAMLTANAQLMLPLLLFHFEESAVGQLGKPDIHMLKVFERSRVETFNG